MAAVKVLTAKQVSLLCLMLGLSACESRRNTDNSGQDHIFVVHNYRYEFSAPTKFTACAAGSDGNVHGYGIYFSKADCETAPYPNSRYLALWADFNVKPYRGLEEFYAMICDGSLDSSSEIYRSISETKMIEEKKWCVREVSHESFDIHLSRSLKYIDRSVHKDMPDAFISYTIRTNRINYMEDIRNSVKIINSVKQR